VPNNFIVFKLFSSIDYSDKSLDSWPVHSCSNDLLCLFVISVKRSVLEGGSAAELLLTKFSNILWKKNNKSLKWVKL
jgi:hypothetical protein